MNKRLYKDEQQGKIGGVCAGLAEYLVLDVSIVRVLFILAFIFGGVGFLLYIILWIVLPKSPYAINVMPGVDYMANPHITPDNAARYSRGTSSARYAGGMVLILAGLFFLFDELNIIPDFDFDYFWPVLLIAVGLVFVLNNRTHRPEPVEPLKNDPFNGNPSQL